MQFTFELGTELTIELRLDCIYERTYFEHNRIFPFSFSNLFEIGLTPNDEMITNAGLYCTLVL